MNDIHAHRPTDQNGAPASLGPCPLFWPEQVQHGVRYVPLQAELTPEIAALSPKLRTLAALGDSLRSLQTREGSVVSVEAADALAAQTASLMLEIADVVGGETAAIIRLRAEALLSGGSHEEAAIREAELSETQPLTLICGPVCTFRLKTRRPLHTVIGAVRSSSHDELVRSLDDNLEPAAASVREDLRMPDLAFEATYPMCVTDLVVCGGEANAYPKHFAYFLPEDEGIPDAPAQRKKTIVFRNAYRDRHTVISKPLGEALLEGPRLSAEVPVERPLLMWFRGHDIAHAVSLPSTRYSWQRELGHEPFMMIQEAVADVYGFLLATSSSWESLGEASPTDVGAMFLAELLHYLRRGPWLHGDAGAAYLELSYLAVNGFVEVSEDGAIAWDPEQLLEGMRDLAATLAGTVLAPRDARPCARLISQYGWPASTPAASVVTQLHGRLRGVPTALAYCDPSALESMGLPGPEHLTSVPTSAASVPEGPSSAAAASS